MSRKKKRKPSQAMIVFEDTASGPLVTLMLSPMPTEKTTADDLTEAQEMAVMTVRMLEQQMIRAIEDAAINTTGTIH